MTRLRLWRCCGGIPPFWADPFFIDEFGMSTHFDFEIQSETLTSEELRAITGSARSDGQIRWLRQHRWPHVLNAAARPVVGRYCARLLLAGIVPSQSFMSAKSWTLPVGKIA